MITPAASPELSASSDIATAEAEIDATRGHCVVPQELT
jgi:hypothetical protein